MDFELEPERYEIHAGPAAHVLADVPRRDFLKTLGGGLLVLAFIRPADAQESGRRSGRDPEPQVISAWLHIAEDGTVTVYTGKAEMGQNIRTSLAQAVAEELRAPMSSIRLVMGDTETTPFDMGTFGSRTTPFMTPQIRRASAAAREALLDLAAERWKCDRADVTASDGKMSRPGGDPLTYGALTKGAKLDRSIGSPALTPSSSWRVLGTSPAKVDGRDFVSGRHQYPSDITRPGMLYGKVLRAPGMRAKLLSCSVRNGDTIAGATVVRDGDFVGVVAPSSFTAGRAIAAIKAEWDIPKQVGHAELYDHLRKTAAQRAGNAHTVGSVADGVAQAEHKLKQSYTVAYIAHAPLEPRAAVAEWNGDRLTVWTGTQRPFGVKPELAEALRIPESSVRVIVPDTGSGYGGKHTGETAVEAARLAKLAGKPVKLVWTRQEEFDWAYFRPAGVIDVSSAMKRDGTITAWEFHNYNSGGAGIRTPYEIPNQSIAFHEADSPLRQGSYRALAATANHFARETHMDELASLAGLDPLEFRLKNAKDARLRAVLEAAAKQFGWSSRPQASGIACGFEKAGYVASCAEIALEPGTGAVRVKRIVTAFDCGMAMNPDHLRNQIEGAAVMGIGGALFESISFENGRILNDRFSKYRVPRFADTPQIEVVIVEHPEIAPAGAGETPIVAVAPAIGNAIHAASGTRLRSLPLAPAGVKVSERREHRAGA